MPATSIDGHQMAVFAAEPGPLALGVPQGGGDAQALLMAGRPLDEPVARHGPFVMNTTDELIEAVGD